MASQDPSTPPPGPGQPATGDTAAAATEIVVASNEAFGPWLGEMGGSLVVSCYQAGKVALVGWDGTQLTLHFCDFPRPMGMAVQGNRIALGTLEEVVLLNNAPGLAAGALPEHNLAYDALYLPRVAYRTGEIAAHGLGFGKAGLWVVNTRFSCLASLSDDYHFVPRWKPPFISDLAPEDRCHMNGMAMADGEPRFVTCLGTTDVAGTWRTEKVTGGVVLSVPDGQVVCRGLTMPHTPRWYDKRLWVLNSGQGQLGFVNPNTQSLEVVCTLPGYLRGLCFLGPYAVVGMCRIREQHIFGGLPIAGKFPELMCGLTVIDIRNGQPVALLRFMSGCEEVFDVDFLPGVHRPAMLSAEHPEIHFCYTAPGRDWWRRDATPGRA